MYTGLRENDEFISSLSVSACMKFWVCNISELGASWFTAGAGNILINACHPAVEG